MSLKERTYSILVVSSTDSFASAFIGSLPEIRYYPVLTAASISAAKRKLKEKSFDFVIINSPLSDDVGFEVGFGSVNTPYSATLS